jgi:hypothetical protein
MTPRILRLAALFRLVLAAAAAAWGPATHEVLNQEAVQAVERPELAFLREPEALRRFVTAGAMPDMTFSFAAGDKTDPAYNDLFHSDTGGAPHGLGRALLARARFSGRLREIAFALGWWAHEIGDDVGNAADSPVHRNILGLPGDLSRLSIGFNKIMVDGMALRRARVEGLVPEVETELLVAAISSYSGPHATADEIATVRRKVKAFEDEYRRSMELLLELGWLIARNPTLVRDLTASELGAPDAWGVGRLEASAGAIRDFLAGVPLPSIAPPASGPPGAGGVGILGVSTDTAAPGQPAAASRVDRMLGLVRSGLSGLGSLVPIAPVVEFLREESRRAIAGVTVWALQTRAGDLLDRRRRVALAVMAALGRRDVSLPDLREVVRRTTD